MTEPTQAAKQRACNLANAIPVEDGYFWNPYQCDEVAPLAALAQLCQDISDAVGAYREAEATIARMLTRFELLRPFILPDEPDVLAEALRSTSICETPEARAQLVRAALAKRGHEVAPIKPTTA